MRLNQATLTSKGKKRNDDYDDDGDDDETNS